MTTEYTTIHDWSEVKLDIIKRYAAEYSHILSSQKNPSFQHFYIDAFSGSGVHISESTGDFVLGSPLNALYIDPPFKEYHFIDVDSKKIDHLTELVGDKKNVFIYQGDCNDLLPNQILGRVKFEEYKRALCLLDPYAINIHWEIVQRCGKMRTVELFINFMIMDMNMNVFKKDISRVSDASIQRMNSFWGDESWREVAYKPARQQDLFDDRKHEKARNDEIAEAYRRRLIDVAGFKFVPRPLAMKNRSNAVVYYLFFASYNKTGKDIVGWLFDKYRNGD